MLHRCYTDVTQGGEPSIRLNEWKDILLYPSSVCAWLSRCSRWSRRVWTAGWGSCYSPLNKTCHTWLQSCSASRPLTLWAPFCFGHLKSHFCYYILCHSHALWIKRGCDASVEDVKAENVLAGCFLAVFARLSVSCRTTRHQASFHTWGNNKQKSQTSSNIHRRLQKFFFVWHFSLISVCLFCQRLCSPPSAASLPSISSAEQPSQRLIGLSLIYSQPPDSRMVQSPQPYICPIICLMLLQLSGRS